MLRVILCIVFVLSANCFPLQSQDQETGVVTLRVGFAPDGRLSTLTLGEGRVGGIMSRGRGTFAFTAIVGTDSEVIVTIIDGDETPIGEVTIPQTDECELVETDTTPPLWIGVVTDECEVIETGGFRTGNE